jgi:hypothetical protein
MTSLGNWFLEWTHKLIFDIEKKIKILFMNIVEIYSHFNGLEFLKIHRKKVWEEINTIVRSVDADVSKVKDSKEENTGGYSSIFFSKNFKKLLVDLGWEEGNKKHSMMKNKKLRQKFPSINSKEWKSEINECDEITPCSFNGTNFIKERISIEIQLDNSYFEIPVLFERHLALYVVDMIDVGISILPMKSFQAQMSSGVPYYEGELYNVIRQGRGVPAVPLVIVGIMP